MSPTEFDQAPHTITPEGRVPKRRIKNAGEALTIARNCIRDNRERARVAARMKAMVDGEPPFSREKKRANGLGWQTNVNPRDAAAHLGAAMVPYYDLFSTQRYRCEIETDDGGEVYASNYSRIITEEVDTFLRRDPCFESEMRMAIYWRVGYGVGTLVWRDPWSPSFRSLRPDKVMVPKLSMAAVENLEFVVIENEYNPVELYRRIEDEQLASESGWNIRQVKMAITEAARSTLPLEQQDYMTFQQLVKNNEFSTANQFPVIRCARVLWREFDGTISEGLVRLDRDASQNPTPNDEEQEIDFLYVAYGKCENMGEVIAAFFQDSDEGYWHGATGQLQLVFDVLQLKNRQFCAVNDGAFMRAGPVVRANSPNGNENAQIIQNGALTILPSSLDVQPATIMGDLQSVMSVSEYNDQHIFANTGVYRSRVEKQSGNPQTATEAQFKYENAAMLSNSAVNRFMSELDVFYKELVRRLLQEDIALIRGDDRKKVQDLRKAIRDRGVPATAFKKIYRVEAYRGLGNGARYFQKITMEEYMAAVQTLSGRGAENFKLDFFATRFGYKNAHRYVGDVMPTPSDERNLWEAQMEAGAIKDGINPFVTDDQDDFIHASEHEREASAAAQAVQQGADKMATLAFLQGMGQHVAEHLKRISGDTSRQAEVKQLTDGLMQMSKFATELQGLIQEEQQQQGIEQQAQAVESGMDPETRIKTAQAAQDMKLKQEKQQVTLDLKARKSAFDQKQKAERQAFDQALKDASTAHAIIQKNAVAANDRVLDAEERASQPA